MHIALAAIVSSAAIAVASAASAETITLSEAIDRALKVAPAVAAAAANSDLSEAQVREARGPLFPGLSAQGEYTQSPGYDPRITNRGQTDALLMLDYTAYDFGRRTAQVRAARYAYEAARLGVAAARAQIVFDTKLAYFDLLHSCHAERELNSSLDRLTKYVATTRALVKSGKAIPSDPLKVEVARDDNELSLAAARRARERGSAVLGSLIGVWGRLDLQPADSEILPLAIAGDLSRSPTLAAAMGQVQSATLAEQAAEAERYPTFKVALNAGFLGVDPPDTFYYRGGAAYDGLVSIPIFSGGAISARIDQARARVREARAAQHQTELDLKRRLAEASIRYQQAREALEILSRAQPAVDDAFALSWARFLGGGGATMLEVLDAYQQAERIRIDRTDQEFAAEQAAAESALVLGLTE
jgi:outer membrane protein TolC